MSHFLRFAGIQSITSAAKTAPLPALAQGERFRLVPGSDNSAVVVAVELIVTIAVPLVVDALRLTVCPLVQVGRFAAFAGVEVTAHDSVTVPVYPVVELTVIVEVPGVPAVTVTAVPDSV